MCKHWFIYGLTSLCALSACSPVPENILSQKEMRAVLADMQIAEAIINAYKENLNSKGFTYTDNKDAADLGIQVSYVQSTYYFTDYGQPEWWWNYPGYWDAPYWGNWGGWYYPYVVNYSITTNSFLTEIMNLKAPEGEKQKLPVLWSSFLSGPASYSGKVNQTLVVRAINQSFAQSPYLTNK